MEDCSFQEYLIKIDLDTHDIIAILVCLSVMVSHIMKRHWITNNIIGIAFSIYGIENLHLSSFKVSLFVETENLQHLICRNTRRTFLNSEASFNNKHCHLYSYNAFLFF